MSDSRRLLAAAVLCVQSHAAAQNAAILQIRIVEGEGLVHSVATRASKPLTVQITDETGKPAEGVAVSFRLPEEGATGKFGNGLRSDIVTSNGEGKAIAWGIEWGKQPGAVEIRITAVKGEARAGTIVAQYLNEPLAEYQAKIKTDADANRNLVSAGGRNRIKWLALSALIAGAAAGGVAAAAGASKSPNAAVSITPQPSAGPPPTTPGFSIGAPIVIVGRPK